VTETETEPTTNTKRAKRRGPSPTARTLAFARKRGWDIGVVEQRIPRTFITRDLFGFIDLVAMDDQPGLLAIQATSDNGGNAAARCAKIVDDEHRPAAVRWLSSGLRLEVWAFGKRGAAGTAKRWRLRRQRATLEAGAIVWSEVREEKPCEDTTAS
jgi:hypothetical protein